MSAQTGSRREEEEEREDDDGTAAAPLLQDVCSGLVWPLKVWMTLNTRVVPVGGVSAPMALEKTCRMPVFRPTSRAGAAADARKKVAGSSQRRVHGVTDWGATTAARGRR